MKAEKKPTTLIYVYCRGQREEKEDRKKRKKWVYITLSIH